MNIQVDKQKLAAFARDYGAKFIALYGSHVGQRALPESDVDVAVFFERGRTPMAGDFKIYTDIIEHLAEATGAPSELIDFITLNRANILLRYEAMSKGILLYGDEDAFEQYRAFAFREYVDARPLFALEDTLIRKRQVLIRENINASRR